MIDYRDWGVPLGRRFRALKLWFVLRSYGVERLQAMLRAHIAWTAELAERIAAEPDFELVTPPGSRCSRSAIARARSRTKPRSTV